ncbi:MAG: hypothetical protein IT580_15670 [Verrucomicrobiales bacterium]|nr:hypothetical protein [Verrucomicrobiales bacterium]
MSDNPFAPPPPPSPARVRTTSSESAESRRGVAIPTTFHGIARVALRGGWRLGAWLMAFALLISALLTWSLHVTWGTSIAWASVELPDAGRIERGIMRDIPATPKTLSASRFLAIILDPEGRRNSGVDSDVLVSVEDQGLAVQSVLGWMWLPYPPSLNMPLDRLGTQGWVAAWTGPALLVIGLALVVSLLMSWMGLAALYAPFVLFAGRLLKRQISLGLAWRLALIALLPAGLLLGAAVFLYANHQLRVVGLMLAWPTHLVLGWTFCAGALFRLPAATPQNPFAPTTSEASEPSPHNPFRLP